VSLSLSRRDGRRFVHISLKVDDVRQLASIKPFSWSTYAFSRDADRVDLSPDRWCVLLAR
jgi:hypothetical protein